MKKSILKLILSILIVIFILLLINYLFKLTGYSFNEEKLKEYIKNAGYLAPLAYIGISILQVSIIPIPSTITIVVGTYFFGLFETFLLAYIGIIIGSILAFFLGRWIGKPFVNWLSGGEEQTDELILKLKGKEKILLFYMFLFPFFPDDLLCSVAGLLPIKFKTFLIMQVITRAIAITGNILILSGHFIPFHGWGIAVLAILGVIMIILFILSLKYSDKILSFLKLSKNDEKKTF